MYERICINGKNYTILWFVNENKLPHADHTVVTYLQEYLNNYFGDLIITRGNKYNFFGMNITIPDNKNIDIDMKYQLFETIDMLQDKINGAFSSPARQHIIHINEDAGGLDEIKYNIFHSLKTKKSIHKEMLRADQYNSVAFLYTRVNKRNENDWKKLK